MTPVLAYLRAHTLDRLRCPTTGELRGGLAGAGLLALGVCAGIHVGGPAAVQPIVGPTRIDTVRVERIRQQEPAAKPGFIRSLAYKDVQPTRVQIAPGAGADVLAAVCDTSRSSGISAQHLPGTEAQAASLADSSATVRESPPPAPALAYAWRVSPTWNPLRDDVRLFVLSQGGEEIRDYRVTVPAEGRLVPAAITREARVPVKRLVWLALPAVAGYVAGRFAR